MMLDMSASFRHVRRSNRVFRRRCVNWRWIRERGERRFRSDTTKPGDNPAPIQQLRLPPLATRVAERGMPCLRRNTAD